MGKGVFGLLAISWILLFFISVASAQSNIEGQIEGAVEGLENNVTKIKEFTEKDKWEFIGLQWKEFLLKNKMIAGIDAFFTKINIVFVVLFARDWSISLEMFFVFMLWVFTLISLYGYFSFFKSNLIRWLSCFAGVIILAQVRVFYYISFGLNKILLYKSSLWWRSLTFIVCTGLIVLYFMINKVISKKLEQIREKNLQLEKDLKVQKVEAFQEGLIEGEGKE
ncbi:MAG: hypothetical protein FJZ43_04680 [Candidatus Staskawiczbacteria bacterium]|nr:hypothetical protein [Candidatus Staskawiczbacteria bacterium]